MSISNLKHFIWLVFWINVYCLYLKNPPKTLSHNCKPSVLWGAEATTKLGSLNLPSFPNHPSLDDCIVASLTHLRISHIYAQIRTIIMINKQAFILLYSLKKKFNQTICFRYTSKNSLISRILSSLEISKVLELVFDLIFKNPN